MSRSTDRDIQQLMQWTLRLREVQDQQSALEEEEGRLKAAIRGWAPDTGAARPAGDDAPKSHTLAAAALAVLGGQLGTLFSAEDIRDALARQGHSPVPELDSLRSTLARLAKKGKITKRFRGQYQALEETSQPTEPVAAEQPQLAAPDGSEEVPHTH